MPRFNISSNFSIRRSGNNVVQFIDQLPLEPF
jgi:hypothetical protein